MLEYGFLRGPGHSVAVSASVLLPLLRAVDAVAVDGEGQRGEQSFCCGQHVGRRHLASQAAVGGRGGR